MKFFKGIILGTALSAGAWMLYNETSKGGMNKMMKQGKRFMRNIMTRGWKLLIFPAISSRSRLPKAMRRSIISVH